MKYTNKEQTIKKDPFAMQSLILVQLKWHIFIHSYCYQFHQIVLKKYSNLKFYKSSIREEFVLGRCVCVCVCVWGGGGGGGVELSGDYFFAICYI